MVPEWLLNDLQNLDTSQQENLINQWINNNIIVEKRLFICARQGNIFGNIKDEYFFGAKGRILRHRIGFGVGKLLQKVLFTVQRSAS